MTGLNFPRKFDFLNHAASRVIEDLRGMPDYRHAKIVVIGGLAVQKYLPLRSTQVCTYSCTLDGA